MRLMPHESGLGVAQEESGPDDADAVAVVAVELFDVEDGVEVFDIQVEEDESFIVAGVVVHNSAVCRGRDGMVVPPDKGPRPPAHIGCRSSTSPVLKSWKELGIDLAEAPEGTRASLNGQVPASETYDSWLRKQSKDFQDDVLGVKKARLFRDGKLPLGRFVDRKGAEYTLDELARRESEAWGKAGLGG